MKKRLLSAFMALVLCLTLLPTAALAEETENNIAVQANTANVAEVTIDSTTTQYTNIVDAFADAQKAESAAVKLLENVTIPTDARGECYGIKLEIGNITLDLNSCTIRTTSGARGFVMRNAVFYINGGGLTVQDSGTGGKIEQPNVGQAIGVSSGNLTVKSGTIEVTSTATDQDSPTTQNCAVFVRGSGVADIQGGTLIGNRGIYIGGKLGGGTLTVSGAPQIQGRNSYALQVEGGTVTLSGGSYTTDVTGGCSIWNAVGTAGNLLASDYRYEYNGTECAYSEDGKGVAGNATVAPRPANEYAYIGKAGKLTTRANCTEITAETWDISQGWHVVKENVTISGLNISGEVDLILCDEATLTVSNNMNVTEGSTLNLYWQSAGSGKLTAAAISVLGTVTAPAGEMKRTTGEGGTTFEKCFEHDWKYTNNGDKHTAKCKLCGASGGSEAHTYENWTPDVSDNTKHIGTCVCGAKKSEAHTLGLVPNDDGLTHKTSCNRCGWTSADEKHTFGENGACVVCGIEKSAEYNGQGYATLTSAIEAAKDGGTVTLARDVSENATVTGGTLTVDLNRKTWLADISKNPDIWGGRIPLTVTGGSVTLENGTLYQGYTSSMGSYGIRIQGGSVTVKGNAVVIGSNTTGSAANISYPAIILESGDLTLETGATLVHGLKVPEDKHLSDYLPAGTAFGLRSYDESTKTWTVGKGLFADAYTTNAYNVPDMALVVETHKHTFAAGNTNCECGFTCAQHDWSEKNGVCTVCGSACPHNAGATEAGGVWACNTCGQTVTAKVVAPGGTTTYYADGRLDNGNVKSGLYFAIKAAKTGSTVAALGGEYSGGYVTGNKTLTLDVSNGKPIDGILYVGEKEDSGNKLIVRGSTEISYVIVAPGNDTLDNTLDLTGWTGRIGSLTVLNGGKATLNGGTFAKLNLDSAAAGSLLASGYAFQNADTGAYVEYSSTANMENVKVVKCPHSGVTLKEDHTGAECKYCGASFAATLDDAPYGTIDAAVTDWLATGGTLKLYADYTAADGTWSIGSGSHTINLNGHMMSVKGDGAFFKPTNNMRLTVTDGTERGQITNILLDGSQGGSFTLESGYVCNLEMTGGAVVALKGGSVDELDVKNCSVNTNLSIQGGSLGKLNIEDWADGMHVSATGGSLGAYTLPSGKILADVLDHQYYATGTSLDKRVDAVAQKWEKFDIKQAPHDFGSTSKAAAVPINGSIPFMVDSPSGNVGVYEVKWYRRTDSGAEHMTENRVAGVNVNDTLEVFCVITGVDRPGGEMQWQVAVKGYTIRVVPAKLDDDRTVIRQKPNTGNTGNLADNRLVVTPFTSSTLNDVEYKFEVTYNGQLLELNKDYTIKDSSNLARNAGTHTLTIEGMGNYTGTAAHQWEIKPYTLSKDLAVTSIVRDYDGTTNLSAEELIGLGRFIENLENRNSKNPSLGADQSSLTIRLGAEDFEVSNVKLGSAEAGDTTASFTIKLKPRPGQTAANFVFEDGTSEMTVKEVPVSTRKAFLSSSPKAGELNVANDHAGVYTLDLSKLLPKLESPKKYGEVTYELGTDAISFTTAGYYDATKGNAEVKGDKLILPIQAVETDTTGNIGSVKVKVSTTNYHDFTLTINVIAKNRITPTGTPTLSKNAITYGDALNTIALSGKLHDNVNNVDVDGTFEWVDGTYIPVVGNGTYAAEWKFTPTDKAAYTETTGTATVKVNKARQSGEISMTGYTYGQMPSMPSLTEQTGDPDAQVTYRYSAAGSGSVQTWDIQNPPALNAGTYRMYASIGDTDNYYGFEAVYCEFVVAKATPTYTVPTGLTAKYGQTLADVTLPDGWSWTDSSESVGGASTAAKTFQAKFTPKDTENYNTVENIELEVTVNKADGGNLKTVELEQKYTDASDHTYTPDWAGLPAGQDWTFSSEASIVLSKQDFAADGSLLTYAISGGKAGDKITITLKASCNNYEDFTITLTITLTAKDDQAALTLTGGTTVVYGQTLQLGTSGGNGNGAVTYTVTNGTGEATIDATGKLTPVKVGKVKVSATKAGDASYNSITSAEVEITITRATPTGEPAYTKITASGKTLADAALGIGTITPAGGTIAWDDPTTTEVVANKSYGWTYTPTDTNYTTRTGTIKLWSKSSGGGSGRTAAVVAPDMPMLYRGCTGDAAKALQEKLNAKGFDSGNVDGIFGAKTYAAVTAFQKANGLGVDGIVGKLTWAKLYDATPVNVTPVTTQPMLRTGSRGDAVRKLQELLNAKGYTCGNVDGIFGSKTKAAVLAFQKANGLGADGIVGPLTWGKLV